MVVGVSGEEVKTDAPILRSLEGSIGFSVQRMSIVHIRRVHLNREKLRRLVGSAKGIESLITASQNFDHLGLGCTGRDLAAGINFIPLLDARIDVSTR